MNTTAEVYLWGTRIGIIHQDIAKTYASFEYDALSALFHLPVDTMLIGNRKYEDRCRNDMCQRVCLYYEKFMKLKAG